MLKKSINTRSYPTTDANKLVTQLMQAFVQASIFYYFGPKYHIYIKIEVSKYVIDGIFTQLILNLSQ